MIFPQSIVNAVVTLVLIGLIAWMVFERQR
jgi:hypothetical protein